MPVSKVLTHETNAGLDGHNLKSVEVTEIVFRV